MNFDTINGQSGSSVVSPSSDSRVHSLDEQWECMSTDSGNSDSIQSIKTVYGGVASQADSPIVLLRNMDTRGVVFSRRETCGRHDSMSCLSTNGHNSDIAAMSDFSDEEDDHWRKSGHTTTYNRIYGRIGLVMILLRRSRIVVIIRCCIRQLRKLLLMPLILTMRIIGQNSAF